MQDTCLSNIFIAHAPSGYLWASGKNSYTGIRFLELNFLIKNDMLAIWRCFLLISALDKLNVRRICTSGLTYGPRNVAHASSFTFKLFTNFEVGTTIHCRRSCCWYVTWACGLTVFGLLILAVVTHDRLYSQPLYLPGLEILWLSVLEL